MSTITETAYYDQLVREGREAREQADNVQWVEGDLALQIETLHPTERPRDPETGAFIADDDKVLKRYAEDIEVNYGTLKRYRQTAGAWPPARRRAGVSFEVHKVLVALDDRFEVIRDDMTKREAARIVQGRNAANYGGEPSWIELVGWVGEHLEHAEKRLSKAEEAITRVPADHLIEKAEKYAQWADGIAARLRRLGVERTA